MISIKSLINIARKEAIKSNHPKFRIGSVIFNKNKIISTGFNSISTHSNKIHPKYKNYNTVHAECRAIIKAKRPLKGMSIFVLRLSNISNKKFFLAKPCNNCMSYIIDVGIKYIYFTDKNSMIKKISL